MATRKDRPAEGASSADGDGRTSPANPGEGPIGTSCPWVRPAAGARDRGYLSARDSEFERSYPTLHAFLTLAGHAGQDRVTGSLLLFAEDGKFKACLNDREEGYYCFCSSDSLQGLWEALERGLKSGGLDWRVSKTKRPTR